MAAKSYSYNIMNAAQVFLAVAFQFLIARVFGIGSKTDIYFLSAAIITASLSLNLLFSEMFLQHYNDLYVRNEEDANRYYRSVQNLSIAVGLATYLAVLAALPLLARMLVAGGDSLDKAELMKFTAIQGLTVIWMRAYTLASTLLNARMHFFFPYFLGAMAQVINIVLLLIFRRHGINVIAYVIVVSSLFCLLAQELYIQRKMLIPLNWRMWHPAMKKLIMSSLPLRLGHQVWSLKDLITASVLTPLGAGMLSSFSYAWKILFTLFTITNSPALQIYQATISRMLSSGKIERIREGERGLLKHTMGLSLLAVAGTSVVMPHVLHYVIGAGMSDAGLSQIQLIFYSLVPVYLVMALEMPFVQLVICYKMSWYVLSIAVLFIVIYIGSLYPMRAAFGVYGISVSMLMAQSINCGIYYYLARRL